MEPYLYFVKGFECDTLNEPYKLKELDKFKDLYSSGHKVI